MSSVLEDNRKISAVCNGEYGDESRLDNAADDWRSGSSSSMVGRKGPSIIKEIVFKISSGYLKKCLSSHVSAVIMSTHIVVMLIPR
jgi:hypothetical protein